MAQLARDTVRGKIAQLEDALDCAFVTGEHAAVLAMMLGTIDYYTARIDELTAKIEILCQPYEHQIAQLDAVPGTGVITAQDIIAEIGTDMTVFPTAAHLVSWAKWCPQVAQSGGKRKGANATGRGNRYLSAALGEAAVSAGRTQSFPGAKYRRLVKRMPKRKALVATGNSLLTTYHESLLCRPASHLRRPRHRLLRTPREQSAARPATTSAVSERLGYKVTIEPIDPGPETPAATSKPPTPQAATSHPRPERGRTPGPHPRSAAAARTRTSGPTTDETGEPPAPAAKPLHHQDHAHSTVRSNATSESLNRLAKLEARLAYGFRNPANQRRRVRIACTRGTRRPSRTATGRRTRQVTGRKPDPG